MAKVSWHLWNFYIDPQNVDRSHSTPLVTITKPDCAAGYLSRSGAPV